jgi:hypothetical protein
MVQETCMNASMVITEALQQVKIHQKIQLMLNQNCDQAGYKKGQLNVKYHPEGIGKISTCVIPIHHVFCRWYSEKWYSVCQILTCPAGYLPFIWL